MTPTRCLAAGLSALVLSVAPAAAQAPPVPPVLIESAAGADSFTRYCAPCHGPSGRGDGAVAAALKTRPADLTALTRRNDGVFPREQVRGYVAGTGRTVAAHGTTEMPVWGPLFRAFESDARTRIRLDNLVTYVESIQAPSTGAADRGRELYLTHCGSCHGTSGRGDGPLAAQLRRAVPDLTHFTRRNGGVFPSERIYRIVDGRDIPSHGDRNMPVWGDAFRASRSAMGKPDADARIAAIVRYLEAIQERGAE